VGVFSRISAKVLFGVRHRGASDHRRQASARGLPSTPCHYSGPENNHDDACRFMRQFLSGGWQRLRAVDDFSILWFTAPVTRLRAADALLDILQPVPIPFFCPSFAA
jgi:hypothetical protein